jgi:hypothetical protein
VADTPDEHAGGTPLNERIVELLVYVPAGLAATVVEELPKLAERGREQLGLQVSSARAIGKFAVEMGADELRRRSTGLLHHHRHRGGSAPPSNPVRRSDPVGPSPAVVSTTSAPTASPPPTTGPRPSGGNGHVPAVSTLSIPGFDTLSASQVVQRLDGLNRTELVSVRAYEASTRGRRTILSRVDQLLDERS